ncbi:MAG: T9SS type A sorting domain-containing protein [Bacteroidota bacterium]
MKKALLFIAGLLCTLGAFAQVVGGHYEPNLTVTPYGATSSDYITITVDPGSSCNDNVGGLSNRSNAWLHSGALTDTSNWSSTWYNETAWNSGPGTAMTKTADGKWQFTLRPTDYFTVGTGATQILGMAFVLNGADAQNSANPWDFNAHAYSGTNMASCADFLIPFPVPASLARTTVCAIPAPKLTPGSGLTICRGSSVTLSAGVAGGIKVESLAGSTNGYVNATGALAKFNNLYGLATDAAGNIYVTDGGNNRIRKITPDGVVTTLTGGAPAFADGNLAAARFAAPQDIMADAAGNLYVADQNNHRIRLISTTGTVSTIAGNGTAGAADGNGTAAMFNRPAAICFDDSGNVIVADTYNNTIRKITPDGTVTTIAGNGAQGFADGTGTAARFDHPRGVAIDKNGVIIVSDYNNNRIRKVTKSGVVTTWMGAAAGFADGIASLARFSLPANLEADAKGNIYVAEVGNHRIRKISPSGFVSTITGTGIAGSSNGDADTASFRTPWGLALYQNILYIGDQGNNQVRKITLPKVDSYIWSNGDTTETTEATDSASYTAQTVYNGCTSAVSSPIAVTVKPVPAALTVTASGTLNLCGNAVVTLTASDAPAYLWSTGATTQSVLLRVAGSYTVRSVLNGCTSDASAPVIITLNPQPPAPVITAAGLTRFCTGDSVMLTSSIATGNIWSTGDTTQSIIAKVNGNYVVRNVVAGCTSAASAGLFVTVNVFPGVPAVTNTGLNLCGAATTTLTASNSAAYLWSTGATTRTLTVNTAGTYSVQAISNGCTSAASAAVVVTANPVPASPSITPTGTNPVCSGNTITLTSSLATGNVWSNGDTTQSITVGAAGNYTVKQASAGCTSAASPVTVVQVNNTPVTPTVTFPGSPNLCGAATILLSSTNSPAAYLWSNGATTRQLTVNTPGTYTVVFISAAGCTSAASTPITVTQNPVPTAPTITADGSTRFCGSGSVTLTSSQATGNLWSTLDTTQSITVNAAGTYTVKSISAGCTSAASAGTVVTVTAIPAAVIITAGGSLNLCGTATVTLSSPNAAGYLWSTGATTRQLTVSAPGTYSVQIVANGCTSAISNELVVTQTALPVAPLITVAGAPRICGTGSVTLTSSSPDNNVWSNGETTQSITVSAAGAFTVRTTANGCTSVASNTITVTLGAVPATPVITGTGTNICSPGTITLTSSNSAGYLWSTGATTRQITVSASGTYTVQSINAGCTSLISAPYSITVNQTPATPVVTGVGQSNICGGNPVTLSSSSAAGNIWSNGATTQTITVSAPGTFNVKVANNGCTSAVSNNFVVTMAPIPSALVVSAVGPTAICGSGTATLTATPAASYIWSNGARTQTITVSAAGTYSVQAVAAGCTSVVSNAVTVNINPLPATAVITLVNDSLDAGPGGVTYEWYYNNFVQTGYTGQRIPQLGAGNYTVRVKDANGCTGIMSEVFLITGTAAKAGVYLQIVPNPAGHMFRIAGLVQSSPLEIINITGQKVYTGLADSNTETDIQFLPSGMYEVRIGSVRLKLVKN